MVKRNLVAALDATDEHVVWILPALAPALLRGIQKIHTATDVWLKKRELFRTTLPFLENAQFEIGGINPRLNVPVPFHYPVFLDITKDIFLPFFRRKRELVRQRRNLKPSSNLVSIGGPVSTWGSRIALGYGDRLRNKPRSILPYEFNLESDEEVWFYLKTVGKFYQPNFSITDRVSKKDEHIPKFSPEGRLERDFLLVSVLPNNLTHEYSKFKTRVCILAGCHMATMIVKRALWNNIETINEQSEGEPFFQSLFEVPRIKHSSSPGKEESIATKVQHMRTVPLEKSTVREYLTTSLRTRTYF